MKTKLIEQYIQFAYENWCDDCSLEYVNKIDYNGWNYLIGYQDKELDEFWTNSLNDVICRKSFIEAIARWIEKIMQADYIVIWWDKIFYDSMNKEVWFKKLVDYITIKQALAIRDNELALFIKEILWIEK